MRQALPIRAGKDRPHGEAVLGFPVWRPLLFDVLADGERFFRVTSASHMPRAVRHFERLGLAPMASPTRVLTGRGRPVRLSYWVPSSDALRKTGRAVYEYLGLRALEWDHRRGLVGACLARE